MDHRTGKEVPIATAPIPAVLKFKQPASQRVLGFCDPDKKPDRIAAAELALEREAQWVTPVNVGEKQTLSQMLRRTKQRRQEIEQRQTLIDVTKDVNFEEEIVLSSEDVASAQPRDKDGPSAEVSAEKNESSSHSSIGLNEMLAPPVQEKAKQSQPLNPEVQSSTSRKAVSESLPAKKRSSVFRMK